MRRVKLSRKKPMYLQEKSKKKDDDLSLKLTIINLIMMAVQIIIGIIALFK